MRILKVREWLFNKANQAIIDGAKVRLTQKAIDMGFIVNPKGFFVNPKTGKIFIISKK